MMMKPIANTEIHMEALSVLLGSRAVGLIVVISVLFGALRLPAQQSEADHNRVEDIKAKAERGNASAQFKLGVAYANGQGVPQDNAEAVNWYRKAADQGVAEAQDNLGLCYLNGQGVTTNFTESVKWFRKAADQGLAAALYNLGVSYTLGRGVTKDMVEAMKLYRKAADQGDAEAQGNLGLCYNNGEGVTKNAIEAVKWYRRAADQGDDNAQCNLGKCYASGRGLPKDYAEAHKWLNLASAQGNEDAKRNLSVVEQWMTPEQIYEAQQLAREFKPRKESKPSALVSSDIPVASGTGFFITDDGYLITNEHVVESATKVRLITSAGSISAKVVKVDAANDLALLKAEGKFSPLPIASSRMVHLGNTVTTVGFPNIGLQGFAPKFARGEIAALSGAADDARYFQISVPVQPGNSGGALVDERGNVVGVVSAKLSALVALNSSGELPENVNYAVKSSFLLSFLESVPEVSDKLKEAETKDRKADDVVKSVEQAAVLVLVY